MNNSLRDFIFNVIEQPVAEGHGHKRLEILDKVVLNFGSTVLVSEAEAVLRDLDKNDVRVMKCRCGHYCLSHKYRKEKGIG